MWPWTYRQYGHFGEVMKSLPFPLEVLNGAHKHDVLELMVMKVAGTEWHHQVPEANQGWADITKDADHYVATQDSHGCFTSRLQQEEVHEHWRDDLIGLWLELKKIMSVKDWANIYWVLTMCYYIYFNSVIYSYNFSTIFLDHKIPLGFRGRK